MSISDFGAFYGSIAPLTLGPPVPTLMNTTLYSASESGNTITLSSSYSTALGDCIIVAYWGHTTSEAFTFSGAGATWTSYPADATANPGCGIAIGYGATAGNTTITYSATTSSTIELVISVWSNVKASGDPVTAHQVATSGAGTATTITTPSLSYSAGQLLVGSGGVATGGVVANIWSNAQSDNAVGTETNVNLSYVIATATTTTTLTATGNGSLHAIRATVLALDHA